MTESQQDRLARKIAAAKLRAAEESVGQVRGAAAGIMRDAEGRMSTNIPPPSVKPAKPIGYATSQVCRVRFADHPVPSYSMSCRLDQEVVDEMFESIRRAKAR